MTLQAQYWVHEPDQPPAERVTELATPEQVREFVMLLASDQVSDALLTHTRRPRMDTLIPDEDDPDAFLTVPDHSVIVGIHGDRGAISYQGNDGHGTESIHLYSHGDDPEQPVIYETDEFPPHCEVPTATLVEALVEFLQTAKRPLTLGWQPAGDSAPPPMTPARNGCRRASIERKCEHRGSSEL